MVISFIYIYFFVRVILFALDHSTSAGVGGWGVFALVFTTHINFFDPYFMVKFRFPSYLTVSLSIVSYRFAFHPILHG